jgi:hypothetical protein
MISNGITLIPAYVKIVYMAQMLTEKEQRHALSPWYSHNPTLFIKINESNLTSSEFGVSSVTSNINFDPANVIIP